MAAACIDFEEWLGSKLQALNTDQEVFGGYITGILDSDDTNEEKLEALEGILAEVSEDSIATLCKEILSKWMIHKTTVIEAKACDVSAKLATIMEQQAQSVGAGKSVSEEDKKYRDAILAQYSQVSDGDEDDKDDPGGGGGGGSGGGSGECAASGDTASSLLVRNTNSEAVTKAEKERRDKAKAETKEKKAADKANREKQKQQQQERKEKEKKRTQKGERKR